MEQLAIIREPRMGCSDRGVVALSFNLYVSDSSAALQVLWVESHDEHREKAFELLRSVSNVSDLDGKACWADVTPQTIHYLRPAKVGR